MNLCCCCRLGSNGGRVGGRVGGLENVREKADALERDNLSLNILCCTISILVHILSRICTEQNTGQLFKAIRSMLS